MKKSKNYIPILVVSLIAIVGVTIAYAAMQTSLTITVNKVTQSALSWNVAFATGAINATTTEGTSATERSCGTATAAATAITLADTKLSKPGDGCIYKFQVKNTGDIDAKLGALTPTAPTGITCSPITGGNMVCGNITYKITTDAAGSTLATTSNVSVAAGATKDLYLVVRYTGTTLNTSAVTHSSAKFTFRFDQV